MPQLFLRANGNWNNNNSWSTSPGGASAGMFPGPGDVAIIQSNFNVTVNVDVTCEAIIHTNGTITAYDRNISVKTFESTGSTSRSIYSSGSDLFVEEMFLSGSNLNWDVSDTHLEVNCPGPTPWAGYYNIGIGSREFGRITVNLGSGDESVTARIIGSGSSRTIPSLIVRSANSQSHEIQLDNVVADDFFSLKGSSPSNRLVVSSLNGGGLNTWDVGIGQYLDIRLDHNSDSVGPVYAGSGSVLGSGVEKLPDSWVLEDIPKISELVDDFDSGSIPNDKWYSDSFQFGWADIDEGALRLGLEGGASSYIEVQAHGFYDLTDSECAIDINFVEGVSLDIWIFGTMGLEDYSIEPTMSSSRYYIYYDSGSICMDAESDGVRTRVYTSYEMPAEYAEAIELVFRMSQGAEPEFAIASIDAVNKPIKEKNTGAFFPFF